MDFATYARESALNRQAYEQLRDSIERDHRGKYVALAHGKLLGAAPTFDEACGLAQRLEPEPEYYLVFPADVEPDFDLVYDLVS